MIKLKPLVYIFYGLFLISFMICISLLFLSDCPIFNDSTCSTKVAAISMMFVYTMIFLAIAVVFHRKKNIRRSITKQYFYTI